MIFSNTIRTGLAVTAATLALSLIGCASPANREAMVPQALGTTRTHPYAVRIQSSGGSDTGAMDSSNISDVDLKAAIEEAVVRNKVFKSVVQGKGGDYELSVRVSNLTKPLIGFSFTVDMEAAWSLVKLSDRSVVMRKSVKSSGTARASDSLVGVTRLRLAVEAAARENISQGLQAVSAMNL
ncbi:hypothetical protein [Aromatoleum aromaticum]|uniref:Lipoprotein n=1 Tax=Aromatoleum aromaticum (strain DSM 19018 / LMG 30748 / EbN1) TaxID=76114 RepID=Q5P6L1_AROAE|nr:hypothetical protein [Aromatoleum aromaticum]NMG54018.1 hypothetical protein [Aromatoleum aromaticum]CAI07050.1 hypothetical protein ebA1714 [Aromatoleum aromaticum EbN1]